MNQNQLYYFIKIYNCQSIKKASEQLFVAPQSLSRTIKTLESELKAELFKRNGNHLIPTKAADMLLPHAQKILYEYQIIDAHEYLSNQICIYANGNLFNYLSTEFFKEFYQTFQNTTLKIMDVSQKEAIAKLKEDKCDFIVTQTPYNESGYQYHYITSCSYCFVVNKQNPLAHKDYLVPRDLNDQFIVGRGLDYPIYENCVHFLSKQNIYPKTIYESNNEQSCLALAEANIAIACISKKYAIDHLSDNLSILFINDMKIDDELYFVYKTTSLMNQEAQTFMDLTKKYIL